MFVGMVEMGWLKINKRCGMLIATVGFTIVWAPAYGADNASADAFIVAATDTTSESLINSVMDRLKSASFDGRKFAPQPIIVSSNKDLTDLINDGVVDLAISDARVAVKAMIKNPMTPAMKASGRSTDLAAVVFAVRDGSPIRSMADLKGRKLAFEGVWNRSGYFGPITLIQRAGYPMEYLDTVRNDVTPDAINFVFAGDEVNMVAWLNRGLIDAIAFNRTDWNNEEETPLHIRETFRLIVDEDVPMDQYVTLTSRNSVQRRDVIQNTLTSYEGGIAPFKKLSPEDEQHIDFLIETYAHTEGNYLAHE